MFKKLAVAITVIAGLAVAGCAGVVDKVGAIQDKAVEICGYKPDQDSVLSVIDIFNDENVTVTTKVVLSVAESICQAVASYEPPDGTFSSSSEETAPKSVKIVINGKVVEVKGQFIK